MSSKRFMKSESSNDPLVIYKDKFSGVYYTTPKSNYDARIQNAHRIQKWDGFDTPQEIIDYCTKYSSGFDPQNVIIVEDKQSEARGSVIDKQTILDWAEQLNSEQDLGLATTDASLGGKETQYEDDADDKQFDCIKFTSNVFPLTFVEVYSITPDSCSVHVYDGRTNKEVGKATLTDSSDLRTAVVASIKQIYDSVHNQRLVDKAMKLQESLNKGTSMKTESIDDLKDRSVSHGTLRSIDLIPEFLGVLQQYAKDRYDAYVKANPEVLDLEGMDDETLTYVVDELIDELNAVAPEGTYFGSHPGDGSDFGFWTMDESKRKESKKTEVNDDTMVIYKELGTYYTTNKKNYDARIQDANRIQKWDGFDTPQEIIDYCKKYSRGFDPDDVLIVESKKSEDANVHELEFVDIDNVHNASDFDKLAYDAVLCCPSDLDVDTDSVEQGVLDNDLIIKVRGFNAASFDAAIDRISQKLAGTGIVFTVDDVIKNEDTYAKKSEGKDDKDKKDDKSCKGKDCKDGKQAENRGKPQEGPGAGYTVTIKDMTISDEPKISKDGDKFIVEAPVEYEADAEGYDWGSAYIMNELVGTDEGTFPYNPFKGVLTMVVKDSPDIWDVMNDKFFDDVDNPTDEEKISVLKDRFYKGATFNDFGQNYGGGYSHSKFVSEDDVCMQADWDGFTDIDFGSASDGYAGGTLTIDDRFIEDIEFASDYGYNRYKLVEAIQQFVKGRGLEMDWSEDTLYDYVAPYVTSDEITDDYVKEILSDMVDSGVEFTDADGNPADLQLESIQGESKKSEGANTLPTKEEIKRVVDGLKKDKAFSRRYSVSDSALYGAIDPEWSPSISITDKKTGKRYADILFDGDGKVRINGFLYSPFEGDSSDIDWILEILRTAKPAESKKSEVVSDTDPDDMKVGKFSATLLADDNEYVGSVPGFYDDEVAAENAAKDYLKKNGSVIKSVGPVPTKISIWTVVKDDYGSNLPKDVKVVNITADESKKSERAIPVSGAIKQKINDGITQCLSAIKEAGAVANPIKVTNSTDKPELSTRDTLVYAPSYVYRESGMERNFVGVMFHVEKDGKYGQLFIGWDKKNNRPFVWAGGATFDSYDSFCNDFKRDFSECFKTTESKKSESLTLKQKELKDMVRYGKAEDITTLPDEEAKELRKKGIETVGVSRGTYGMNGALLRDKDGNLYAITARSTNLFYFV